MRKASLLQLVALPGGAITETLVDCEVGFSHVGTMPDHLPLSVITAALGQPAPNRGPVDLLMEASRLNFSPEEIEELQRLYAAGNLPALGKKPQTQT